ncbi:hypothetical protein ABZS66_19075 [Dactylosporangium sp. NPDC005572]|uniref:hypothetical protein n=1 Tax=Dactylosporangium sp. NPDC005572 TaxID=3156889 RepID=UPI0033B5D221
MAEPQVFEVPHSPPGVTRVQGMGGSIWVKAPLDDFWECVEGAMTGDSGTWAYVLTYGPLTDITPPREPRTWPKLQVPDVEAVRGASGRVYRRVSQYGSTYAAPAGDSLPFLELQRTDGPLTEVLDAG